MTDTHSAAPGLESIRGLIIDMDGVLWEGDTALPGMQDFLSFLRQKGIRFILATNNASRTPSMYQEKLAHMHVTVGLDEILTSAIATARYLQKNAKPGSSVFVVGEAGLLEAVTEAGMQIADPGDLHADYVVCGMDRTLSWEKLGNATINIRNGAKFIGTNPDTTLPTERGTTHGNGAILAALTTATGVAPFILGKPFPSLYEIAIASLNLDKRNIAALGDRLETDIAGAKNAGIESILVLTGITKRNDLIEAPTLPTWVFENLPTLQKSWISRLS